MKNIFSLFRWLVLALLPLLAHAGTPVLTLQATVPASSVDVTAFVDRVEILSVATGAVVASAVPNAGFETTGSLGAGSYGYNPTGASWAFNAQSGLATNGSGFNNPAAPEGIHVAFLQTNSGGAGSLSQTLPSLPAGLYRVRVQLAQRGTAPANQGVRLLIDGSVVGTYTPANDGVFHSYTSPVFLVDAVLRFEGTGSQYDANAYVVAFLDQVEIINMATGQVVAGAVPNAGFETTGSLGAGSYAYNPTGANWTFNAQSGIAANGSSLNNVNAPEGTHVAMLEGGGSSIQQALLGLPAGSYQVRVRATQRTYDQGVRVLLNGVLLQTFMTVYSSFDPFQSATFTIAEPVITSFTPTSGPEGTSVTITGTGLSGATSVSFNGTPQTNFSSSTGTSLMLTVPAGAPTGPLAVTTPSGISSPSAPFTVCRLVANGQNAALTLASDGTGSIAASAFNNGSSSTCGPVTASVQKGGGVAVYGSVAEGGTLTLTAPAGTTFTSVDFASYGTPTGTNGSYTQGSCHSANSQSVVETALLGRTGAVSIVANNANFGGDPCGGTAKTLAVRASYSPNPATTLAYTCAELGPQPVLLTLSDAGGNTSTQSLTVTVAGPPAATIASLSPQPAVPGTTVTATGTNLSGATGLTVNGVTTAINSLSATGFTFVVPGGLAGTGSAVLTLPCAQSLTRPFDTGLPSITAFTPASGLVNTSVTISGTNLANATALTLNGVAVPLANITTNTATLLTFTLPVGATTGPLVVTTASGSATSSASFSVLPGIVSFTPTNGGVGTSITITGTTLTGVTGLTLNGVAVPVGNITANTATSLTFTVPAGSRTGQLTVTTPSGTSPLSSQTFYIAPVISSLSPSYGPVGTSLALAGVNLAGATGLTLNGAAVPVGNITSNTATALAFTVPAGATTGTVTVTNPAGTSPASSQTFTVTTGTPGSLTFSPASGAVGTVVTLTGTGLAGATAVAVNGFAGNILNNSATSLAFTVGTGSTTGRIVVRTPTGTAVSATNFVVGIPQPACFEVADTVSTAANGGYTALPRCDDCFQQIDLGFSFRINGQVYTSCFVNNNGTVSFGAGVPTWNPGVFPGATVPIIAPFFGDVDTRPTNSGRVWYKLYPDRLVVLWNRVGYYSNRLDKKNTFEVIIRRNTVAPVPAADITLAYGDMRWTTGDASNAAGAVAGFDAADGTHYYNVGSFTNTNISSLSGSCINLSMNTSPQPAGNYWQQSSVSSVKLLVFSPSPAGVGQDVVATGQGLAGATRLVVNGADATASLANSAAGGFSFRVPTAASLTGITTLTATNTVPPNIALSLLPAPGNALALDGTNDYVSVPHAAAFNLTTALTLEAWVRTSVTTEQYIITKSEDSWFLGLNGVGGAPGRASFYLNGPSAAGGWLYGTSIISDGHWHHVAGTYDGATLSLYVDGVLEGSRAASGAVATGTAPLLLGSRPTKPTWNGSLDEVRIWRTARTVADIVAGLYQVPALPQTALAAYFNFDRGLPGGQNQNYDTFREVLSGLSATLTNVALTGTASNWVESYALVVPPTPVATAVTRTSFTVSWQLPELGSVTGFGVDVSTSATFATITNTFTLTSPTATSQAVAGLTAGTRYYFRVRADRTPITGQGAYATGSVTLPTAACAVVVSSFTPASGSSATPGTLVTLTGTGLTAVTGVSFGGVPATTFTVVNATTVTARVPAGALSGPIGLVTACGTFTTAQLFSIVATLAQVSPAAELPGQAVTITGSDFVPGSRVSFGSQEAAGVTYNSPGSLTAIVPVGAGNTVVVSTANGDPAPVAFSLLSVADAATLNVCTNIVPATNPTDSNWHYLLSSTGQVVLAYNTGGRYLGRVGADFLLADPAQPVRRDSHNQAYLGRNWHLTADLGIFPGNSVKVRFYGVVSEYNLLKAADPAHVATLADLRLTQYSGPNEDCALANNNNTTTGSSVLLTPATTYGPDGSNFFVAEAVVPNHFSEFYLGGNSSPLPVELTAFTATLADNAAVRLAWATASEKNSARFEVERSLDGARFGLVGTVPAAGSSTTTRAYQLLDAKLPAGATTLYYRLRQVDLDGTAAYSPVRSVTLNSKAVLALFPNPTTGAATLTGTAPGTPVQVFDALGRQVTTAAADAAGTATLVLPRGLATGVYVVRAGATALRLTVE